MPRALVSALQQIVLGQERTVERLVASLLAGGHVLLDDVPGVGKTLLARSLANLLDLPFRRVQFSPDMMPSDVSGSSLYHPPSGEFRFVPGPLFTHVLLADEINRASPRTQSALLEAMEEARVTVDGVTHDLPHPFWVIATQNPVEFHGTFPLPEAQLDRFAVILSLGYPSADHEQALLGGHGRGDLRPFRLPSPMPPPCSPGSARCRTCASTSPCRHTWCGSSDGPASTPGYPSG